MSDSQIGLSSSLIKIYISGVLISLLSLWQRKVFISHGPHMNMYRYWCTMLQVNGWATSCETEITAMIWGYKITVWLKGKNSSYLLSTFRPQNSENIINLLLENNHFKLMHKLPGHMVTTNKKKKKKKKKNCQKIYNWTQIHRIDQSRCYIAFSWIHLFRSCHASCSIVFSTTKCNAAST